MRHEAGNADSAPPGSDTPNAAPAVLLLCRGVRAGDRVAFTTLYDLWYERWLCDARTILLRNDPLAYDIVQDAFVRVIKSLPELRSDAALSAWMTRVLRSSAVDVLRKESRRRARERTQTQTPQAHGTRDEGAWITAALASLEQDDVLLLRTRVVEELTLEQSGRAVGVSGDAAHGRIRRALATLRNAWRGKHD